MAVVQKGILTPFSTSPRYTLTGYMENTCYSTIKLAVMDSQHKIQSDLGYPATSGSAPIRILSNLAGYANYAHTQQVQ